MSPFKFCKETAFHIQCTLPIALLPLVVWGIYVFGTRVLLLSLFSVVFSVLAEFLFYLIKRKTTDFSLIKSINTGLLSALILPVTAPLWIGAVCGFISSFLRLVLSKDGFYSTLINPVAASGIIFYGLFESTVNRFTAPFLKYSFFQFSVDSPAYVTTILQSLQNRTDSITTKTILNTFLGRDAGAIGEISAILIILGGIFLIYKKYISFHIPVLFISSLFLLSFFIPTGNCEAIFCASAETLSGSLLFVAVFIASLPSASPITKNGKIIFGIACGVLTFILRRFSGIADGALFAVAVVSCFSNFLDRMTNNKYFSYKQKVKTKNQQPQKTNLEELLKETEK